MLKRCCDSLRGGGNFAFYCIWMFTEFMAANSTTATINKPAVKIFTHQQNKTHFKGKSMGLLDQVEHICINYLFHILITGYKSCD